MIIRMFPLLQAELETPAMHYLYVQLMPYFLVFNVQWQVSLPQAGIPAIVIYI